MQSPQGPGRHAQRAGFTLIELMVSFSALLIVLLGFSRMLLSSHMASNTSLEATLAKEAARAKLEELQGADFHTLYACYNSNPADDPGGNGTAKGASFTVPGLEVPASDADGRPGQILFPESNGVLSETVSMPQYGWPQDMDGDGAHDTNDVSATYRLLPVVVRVAWRGAGGAGTVEFKTVIGSF